MALLVGVYMAFVLFLYEKGKRKFVDKASLTVMIIVCLQAASFIQPYQKLESLESRVTSQSRLLGLVL